VCLREREKRESCLGDKMERKRRNIIPFVTSEINCFDFIKIAVIFLKSF
jgi:hypothetical protein